MRMLIAGTLLILAGLGCWALYVKDSGGGEHHSYNRAGRPPAYVELVAGKVYHLAVHGGVAREAELGVSPGALQCTAARPGQAATALEVTADKADTKATNQIGSFVSALSGRVHVECTGIGTVYVDDAADAAFDRSGVWLVLASVTLAVGLPLALSGLRAPIRTLVEPEPLDELSAS
jgi:hypothetical protein